MRVFIMRHGDALPTGGEIPDDSVRPLSELGCDQARRAAAGLKASGNQISRVYCSPLIRAHQTARLMAEGLGLAEPEATPALSPGAAPAGFFLLLESIPLDASALLVAHHPDVTLWTAFLTGINPGAAPQFSTASIAAIDLTGKKAGTLLWFKTVQELARP
jgi:phosphohistidine phosphatase